MVNLLLYVYPINMYAVMFTEIKESMDKFSLNGHIKFL
jgi:hypothetical protein